MVAEEERELRYGMLNVVATPHPPGVYEKLIRSAAKIPINFWGDLYASITEPVVPEDEDDLLMGRLVMWTKIDENEPAVLTDDLAEVSFQDLHLNIPNNVGFNGRVFLWAFRLSDHKLFIELNNEIGRTLSPQRAAKFFGRLLSPEVLGADSPFVEVTVCPDDDSLDLVLSIPTLKKITIHLLRPNPDDIGAETARILTRLETMGAKSQHTELTKHTGETLELDQELMAEARVASSNGYVESRGYEDGQSVHRSTKHYPKIVSRISSAFNSGISAAISVAKETLNRDQ